MVYDFACFCADTTTTIQYPTICLSSFYYWNETSSCSCVHLENMAEFAMVLLFTCMCTCLSSHGKDQRKLWMEASHARSGWWRHVARPERPRIRSPPKAASYGTSCSVRSHMNEPFFFLLPCIVSLGLEYSKLTRSVYKTNGQWTWMCEPKRFSLG